MQVPAAVTFLQERGNITDHNAGEVKRYLNVFAVDPVTVPAGGEFFSTMMLITFKAFDICAAFVGGGAGCPLYKDDNAPVHGRCSGNGSSKHLCEYYCLALIPTQTITPSQGSQFFEKP